MKRRISIFTFAPLLLMLAAPASRAEERCSNENINENVISALEKLNSREKLARSGLQLWERDLPELRKNAKEARILTNATKMAAGTALIYAGGLIFIGKIAIPAAYADLALPGLIIGGAALVVSPIFLGSFDKGFQAVNSTFSEFDRKRARAGGHAKAPTGWDLIKLGSETAAYSKAWYDEAAAKSALYKQELEFIQKIRPQMVAFLKAEACKPLKQAVSTRDIKPSMEEWNMISEPSSKPTLVHSSIGR